ncbi:MAG: ribosome biogenesis GTPase Der [Acidobacteria bacterium]|nr:ribosome biogenesis GTPase Der [Acidobacteriota bacterium]
MNEEETLPVVAIVGRPNVGKSTLVNRVLGRREAIVEERPGVTRDRKEIAAEWLSRPFMLVDTGGLVAGGNSLDVKVSAQSQRAIAEADVIVMVVDGTVGVTGEDADVARLIRQTQRPTVLVVNKSDDLSHDDRIWDFMALGLGDPIPISALHGRGTGDFLDAVIAALGPESDGDAEGGSEAEDDPNSKKPFRIALVGRPNVGKSTLFNKLIGDERAVVHDRPGTTRDAIDTVVETEMGPVCFIDTAGMRRKAKIDEDTEYYSFVRALSAVDTADIALLVIDASLGITHQDQRLAERVDAAGCPIVIVLNKWDLLDTEQRLELPDQLERRLHFLGEPPVLRMSALSGQGVDRLIGALMASAEAYRTRIPTAKVNAMLRKAQSEQPAPAGARVLYATQGATDPPTFVLFVNKTLPRTYIRYLERRLREGFDLGATPIKMRVRTRSD